MELNVDKSTHIKFQKSLMPVVRVNYYLKHY